MKRYELINELINRFGYKRYLEIGLDNGTCFASVNCHDKTSVDPAQGTYAHANPTYKLTSDTFFEYIAHRLPKFDIIFIDGLHHADQVERDIFNSLKRLNSGGSIVLHDCNPIQKNHQIIPRSAAPGAGPGNIWNGDTWKVVPKFRNENKTLGCLVIDSDHGLGWIHELIPVCDNYGYDISYESLDKNREKYLGLIDVSEFNNFMASLD
jgi:hypothetical protein